MEMEALIDLGARRCSELDASVTTGARTVEALGGVAAALGDRLDVLAQDTAQALAGVEAGLQGLEGLLDRLVPEVAAGMEALQVGARASGDRCQASLAELQAAWRDLARRSRELQAADAAAVDRQRQEAEALATQLAALMATLTAAVTVVQGQVSGLRAGVDEGEAALRAAHAQLQQGFAAYGSGLTARQAALLAALDGASAEVRGKVATFGEDLLGELRRASDRVRAALGGAGGTVRGQADAGEEVLRRLLDWLPAMRQQVHDVITVPVGAVDTAVNAFQPILRLMDILEDLGIL